MKSLVEDKINQIYIEKLVSGDPDLKTYPMLEKFASRLSLASVSEKQIKKETSSIQSVLSETDFILLAKVLNV